MNKTFLVLTIILSILLVSCSKPNNCSYGDSSKEYVSKDADSCSRIKFVCDQGFEYFSDECGCGCKDLSDKDEKTYCIESQRNAEACTMEYNPVCGWWNSSIQCFKYPCAATYGNVCMACADGKVLYWTKGECPV